MPKKNSTHKKPSAKPGSSRGISNFLTLFAANVKNGSVLKAILSSALLASLVVGVLASLFDSLSAWLFPSYPSWLRCFNIILNSAGLWLALSFWAASQGRSKTHAIRRSSASIALLLTGYYLSNMVWASRHHMDLSDLVLIIGSWAAFTLVAALVFGHLGWQHRQSSWPIYIVYLTIATEAVYQLWLSRVSWWQDKVHLASWLSILTLMVILAAWRWHGRSRAD